MAKIHCHDLSYVRKILDNDKKTLKKNSITGIENKLEEKNSFQVIFLFKNDIITCYYSFCCEFTIYN